MTVDTLEGVVKISKEDEDWGEAYRDSASFAEGNLWVACSLKENGDSLQIVDAFWVDCDS